MAAWNFKNIWLEYVPTRVLMKKERCPRRSAKSAMQRQSMRIAFSVTAASVGICPNFPISMRQI
jgi:hypothetical protein